MSKEEWGVKRLCPTTGRRFYDLNRLPVVSPYTGEVVNIETGKASRVLVADKADAKTVAVEATEEAEELVIDDAEGDIEDEAAESAESAESDLGDAVLEDDDDDDEVSLEEIADVPASDDDS